ncbi:MAG TPA: TldD/PmbA family protein [Deltaproteobacteria bacterium]|nr:TldD/PmbA family protein [Deltaproteobacteria bacterium]
MDKDMKRAEGQRTIEALKGLLKGRPVEYEIFFSHDSGFGADAKEGEIDALKARSNAGVGLRTISNNRLGFGFSSVLTYDALSDLVGKTLTGSRESSEDAFLGLPEYAALAKDADLGVYDESYDMAAEEEKIRHAIDIEAAALSYDLRVKRVRKASYNESVRYERIVNSKGVDAEHEATYFSGSVTAVAEENDESQMGWDMALGHLRKDVDPATVGRGAAENAVRLLGARKLKSIKCPAIVENVVACELLEALAGSFLGDNVEKKRSMLIGKVGAKIASGAINIYDDGLKKGGWAASPFDGEGAGRQRTPLVVNGACQGYLYDTYWGRRADRSSTGNATRSGFKSTPGVGISNLYIENGAKSLPELKKELGNGLFVTEVLGVHTINTVTGDFSIGAAGLWIENGGFAYPVRGLAVSGNLLDLFSRVGAVASDIRFMGSIGAPSLLITEIEASGQ